MPRLHDATLAEVMAERDALRLSAAEQATTVERLTRERDEARDEVPHPGDGTCENCGKCPSVYIPTSLCDECIDGVARAESAEAEAARLTAKLAEARRLDQIATTAMARDEENIYAEIALREGIYPVTPFLNRDRLTAACVKEIARLRGEVAIDEAALGEQLAEAARLRQALEPFAAKPCVARYTVNTVGACGCITCHARALLAPSGEVKP